MRAASYKQSKDGHDCPVDRDDEPCWGEVGINDWLPDEGSFFGIPVYTCCGHEYMMCQAPDYIAEKR